jgi:hypothetical protein
MNLARGEMLEYWAMLEQPHVQTLDIRTPIERDIECLLLQPTVRVDQKVFLQRKIIGCLFDNIFHDHSTLSLTTFFIELMRRDFILNS